MNLIIIKLINIILNYLFQSIKSDIYLVMLFSRLFVSFCFQRNALSTITWRIQFNSSFRLYIQHTSTHIPHAFNFISFHYFGVLLYTRTRTLLFVRTVCPADVHAHVHSIKKLRKKCIIIFFSLFLRRYFNQYSKIYTVQ